MLYRHWEKHPDIQIKREPYDNGRTQAVTATLLIPEGDTIKLWFILEDEPRFFHGGTTIRFFSCNGAWTWDIKLAGEEKFTWLKGN